MISEIYDKLCPDIGPHLDQAAAGLSSLVSLHEQVEKALPAINEFIKEINDLYSDEDDHMFPGLVRLEVSPSFYDALVNIRNAFDPLPIQEPSAGWTHPFDEEETE